MITDLATAAMVASLAAEDDPSVKERVERALDRVQKLEQTVALLRAEDVPDVKIEDAPTDPPVTAAITTDPPEGVDPIVSWSDLKSALKTVADSNDVDATKAYIKARARQLHAENMLPDSWE